MQPGLNVQTTFIVQQIKANASSFHATGKGCIMYCHELTLLVPGGGGMIMAQMCTEQETMDFFEPNDEIAGMLTSVNAAKKVPYTFKFIDLVKKNGEEIKKPEPSDAAALNKIVSGTVADRALANACTLFAGNLPNDKNGNPNINLVINTALIFQDYYLSKNS